MRGGKTEGRQTGRARNDAHRQPSEYIMHAAEDEAIRPVRAATMAPPIRRVSATSPASSGGIPPEPERSPISNMLLYLDYPEDLLLA